MPAKKDTSAPKKAAAASVPAHGSYKEMIKEAILTLKDRTGSSRQAIKKYIIANNNLGSATEATVNSHINIALKKGEESGDFSRPKGASGPVKLAKKEAGAAKKPTATPAAKATKAEEPEKKATKAPAKKATAAASKPSTAKAAPKKAAAASKAAATTTKTKANTAKARKPAAKKTATAANAVSDDKPQVLSKTKSGRVSKGSGAGLKNAAPATKRAVATKKSPAKKATPAKKASPAKKVSPTKA